MLLLSKTIIYRVYSLVILIAVSLAITGNIQTALQLSLMLELIKLLQYYVFEEMWKTIIKKHI